MSDEHPPPDDEQRDRRRGPGLRGAARRFVGELGKGDEGALPRTRELLGAVLDGSDKVKTEAVRMVGREVRTHLEGLGLDEAVMHLLTNYSLEVNASFHLKPLAAAMEPTPKPRDEEPTEHGERPEEPVEP